MANRDAEKETITISCALCSAEHEYTLRVTRSHSFSLTSLPPREQQRQKRVNRLFTCPTKNESFQVTLTLWEFPSAPIISVEVE